MSIVLSKLVFYYSQVVVVFTMLPMDKAAVERRKRTRENKTDDELGKIYDFASSI